MSCRYHRYTPHILENLEFGNFIYTELVESDELSNYLTETEMEMEQLIDFDDPIFINNNNNITTRLNYSRRIPVNTVNNEYDVQELTANFLNN